MATDFFWRRRGFSREDFRREGFFAAADFLDFFDVAFCDRRGLDFTEALTLRAI
ncbi:hypothetical protein LJR220_001437 [Bradyrhizobium sp. LjRoot220]|uniref:hypothetical protein n=1 Tax=Bradyrhizobium sp. LjRoot220 TaxID=3342284 RepID=UPI003ECF7179